MPLYTNPDFQRLPSGPAALFARRAQDSFFALPAWYDLMARHGVAPGTEIRLYTDERPGSAIAVLLQAAGPGPERRLASLVNAYGVEHGIACDPDADLESGLARIVSEIVAERPRWDCLTLAEFDPREPGYGAWFGRCGTPVCWSNAYSTPAHGTRTRRASTSPAISPVVPDNCATPITGNVARLWRAAA